MGLKQAAAFSAQSELRSSCLQVSKNHFQLGETWTLGVPVKRIRQGFQDTVRISRMNQWVGTVQITQRFRKAMRDFFKNKPLVRGAANGCPRYSKPQFEGHVESWRWRLSTIELDSREIVKRISATAYQLHDSVEPTLARWNFESGSRHEAEAAQASNEGEVKRFVSLVVWDVQERGGLCRCSVPSFGIRLAEDLR